MSFEAGLNVSLDGSYEMGNSYGRDASLAAITQNAVASRSDVHLALPSRRGSLPIHASAHQDHEIPNVCIASISMVMMLILPLLAGSHHSHARSMITGS